MFDYARELIDTIMKKDPAAHSRWEVIFAYPGFHAVEIWRFSHWCWMQGWHSFARVVSHAGRFLTGIEIHPAAKLGRRVFIDHGMGVVIGETAEVGDDCTLYHGVTLGGTSLVPGTKRHPTLGKGVIVGAGAKVLGGFTVGDGARIGSNAVVVKPVDPDTTIVGVPGRRAGGHKTKKFEAYAVESGTRDPYSVAIQELLRITHEQGLMIERLSAEVAALGGKPPEKAPQADESLFKPANLKKGAESKENEGKEEKGEANGS
jgi:serine O-acetyltransferase